MVLMFRSPALLKLARNQPCAWCGCNDGTTVAAHADWSDYGKGMGLKAHDCYIAFLCQRCHSYVDQSDASREDKRSLWIEAHKRTLLYLFDNELIVVSNKKC